MTEITTRLRHGDLVEAVGRGRGRTRDVILIGKRGEAADFAKGHLGSNLERIVRASHQAGLRRLARLQADREGAGRL